MNTFSLYCVYVVLGIFFLRLCFCVYDEHKVTKKIYPRFPWTMAFQRVIISPLIEWSFIIVSISIITVLCVGCVWFLLSFLSDLEIILGVL